MGQTQQAQSEVKQILAALEAKGIRKWEILNAWSELAYQQGNYPAANTLATAALALGKPVIE